jgi:hypothetical protein
MLIAELLAVDSPVWTEVVESCPHDVYHLPEYVALSARHAGGEPVALYVRDGARSMLLPLILRPLPGGARDAGSPYGYPGPVLSGTQDPAFLAAALVAGSQELARASIVTLFVRLHPILNQGGLPHVPWTIVRHGDTVAVDLSLSTEELWHQTRSNHRLNINRARKQGHHVSFDDDWSHTRDFVSIYRETMDRLSADPFYLFDEAYFEELHDALAGRVHLVTVEVDGCMSAAGIFTESSGIVQYHLSAWDTRYAAARPTKLMLHEVGAWAKERGNRWLHLGGGLGAADDSLLHFKAGFSPVRFPFHTLRVVLRETEYRSLVQDLPEDGGHDDLVGYFPAYRSPRPRGPAERSMA